MRDSGLDVSNIAYLEELYSRFSDDELPDQLKAATSSQAPEAVDERLQQKQNGVNRLLWAYRELGYLYADLNPLKGYITREMSYSHMAQTGPKRNLEPSVYDLTPEDMGREFFGGPYIQDSSRTLQNLIDHFRKTYCSTLGVEFLHIQNSNMRAWLMERLEGSGRLWNPLPEDRREILHDLVRAREFERFLGNQFLGQKRFSLEGAEALIPALRQLAAKAAAGGAVEIVLGMSHRGRLNVLSNVLGKPATDIFATFGGSEEPAHYLSSGDVKYHLGYGAKLEFPEGSLQMSMVPNPSHLESVNPVVLGKVRGFQSKLNDKFRKKVIPVLIHGDAAFSGQGIVAETLNMAKLKGYTTGGTIHIVVNNQIGFTTASSDARSTFFPTNIAKGQPIPIFHVNGYDPEQVVRAVDLALRYRQKFGFDAIIDLICYRVHGHNEADEPTFTHPKMYSLIKAAPGVWEHYGRILAGEGAYPADEQKQFVDSYIGELKRSAEEAARRGETDTDDAFEEGEWQGFCHQYAYKQAKTGLPAKRLKELGEAAMRVPEEITMHSKLVRIIGGRREMIREGKNIDWATGEMLAFASLLTEGYPVRLSGEDSGRGTFSHRHAVWWHSGGDVMKAYFPLQHLDDNQAPFKVYDSPLSEFAVLGFEFGYAVSRPRMLVLWEAQFGDFANEAQVIIDQYIASSETKWNRQSGLVLLLPHGYEGQGPEHSSGYLERYLQLCAEENMQVCNCTTPAQYYHLLRRQMLSAYRKPLVLMTPKSLLRDKRAVSSLKEFSSTSFRPLIHDGNTDAEFLLACSGKIYYDLADRLAGPGESRWSLLRVEQFYPFHGGEFSEIVGSMKRLRTLRWVQEEPRNRGGWSFIREHLEEISGLKPEYIGREAKASPATGHYSEHIVEQRRIIDEAFKE
jgi:2-oxoglutarate dehydrogenase E1 component